MRLPPILTAASGGLADFAKSPDAARYQAESAFGRCTANDMALSRALRELAEEVERLKAVQAYAGALEEAVKTVLCQQATSFEKGREACGCDRCGRADGEFCEEIERRFALTVRGVVGDGEEEGSAREGS